MLSAHHDVSAAGRVRRRTVAEAANAARDLQNTPGQRA